MDALKPLSKPWTPLKDGVSDSLVLLEDLLSFPFPTGGSVSDLATLACFIMLVPVLAEGSRAHSAIGTDHAFIIVGAGGVVLRDKIKVIGAIAAGPFIIG